MRVLDAAEIEAAAELKIAADVNAVPPLGVEGVDLMPTARRSGARRGRDRRAGDRQRQISDGVRPVQTDDGKQDRCNWISARRSRWRGRLLEGERSLSRGQPLIEDLGGSI